MTDGSDDPPGDPPGGSADAADAQDAVDDSAPADARNEAGDAAAPGSTAPDAAVDRDAGDGERDRLTREEVEERYDFEDFGPRDMAEMSYEEWEAAFDADTWITGDQLLDRVEADLKSRVADRDVFAVTERIEQDGEEHLLAYSDEGYAVVYPDGSVQGSGTVLRDVKPSVALASMESYEVPDAPDGDVLPDPAEVPEGSGELGNQLMQVIAAAHVVAGVALLLSGPLFGVSGQAFVIAAVAGVGFLLFGAFVFLLVANARLSDRFRAEEYRNRLRAIGIEDDERPEFLPGADDSDARPETGASADESGEETGTNDPDAGTGASGSGSREQPDDAGTPDEDSTGGEAPSASDRGE